MFHLYINIKNIQRAKVQKKIHIHKKSAHKSFFICTNEKKCVTLHPEIEKLTFNNTKHLFNYGAYNIQSPS